MSSSSGALTCLSDTAICTINVLARRLNVEMRMPEKPASRVMPIWKVSDRSTYHRSLAHETTNSTGSPDCVVRSDLGSPVSLVAALLPLSQAAQTFAFEASWILRRAHLSPAQLAQERSHHRSTPQRFGSDGALREPLHRETRTLLPRVRRSIPPPGYLSRSSARWSPDHIPLMPRIRGEGEWPLLLCCRSSRPRPRSRWT